jgi:hypothetical protein
MSKLELVPEYSPRMLKAFLRAGATYRCFAAPMPGGRDATIKRYKADIRKLRGWAGFGQQSPVPSFGAHCALFRLTMAFGSSTGEVRR